MNSLLIEEDDFEGLKHSIQQHDNFDQPGLAAKCVGPLVGRLGFQVQRWTELTQLLVYRLLSKTTRTFETLSFILGFNGS